MVQVQLRVPDGLPPGAQFQAQGPSGQVFTTTVPMALGPDRMISANLPDATPQNATQTVQFVIPSGVFPGQQTLVNTPGGPVMITVPQGSMPGQQLQMQVPVAQMQVPVQPLGHHKALAMSSLFPLLKQQGGCDKIAEVRAILEAHPEVARERNEKGDLPLHRALECSASAEVTLAILKAHPKAAREKDGLFGKLPLEGLVEKRDPEDPTTGPLLGALIEAAGGIDEELNSDKQTSRTILRGATREAYRAIAETFGAFLGRFKLVDEKKHGSGTCLVIFALDLKTGRPVALKLMEDRAQWVREQDMRKLDGGELLDSQHVVQILDAEELEADADSKDPRLKGATEYRFLLVMPQARRDLSDALSHDQLAGHDKATVVQIMHQVARHLKYLNEGCGRVHGDLKPRNLVQMLVETASGQAEIAWVLIDLDASCDVGTPAGQKVTSSALFPPEMARQQLAKVAGPKREARVRQLVAEKTSKREAAVAAKDMDAMASLTSELRQLDAELRYVGGAELVLGSVQLECWYFGCMLYQLCTLDGATLWDANQADNIDDEQLRELAYQWPEKKPEKLKKIVWPQAAHLVDWLLQEDPNRRPKSWDVVMQHPLFESVAGPAEIKRVVMSCPELGTLDKDGEGPYDQKVMETVSELQRIGYVKIGFDRAGTSTAREKDAALFVKAFALLDEGKRDEAIELLKSTDWWYGYQTSVKQAVKLECQSFDGTLDVTCIKGGFITQLEAAEMAQIMADAQSDCVKSGISVRFTITEVSYHDFLQGYHFLVQDDFSQQSEDGVQDLGHEDEQAVQGHGDSANASNVSTGSTGGLVTLSTEAAVGVEDLRAALDRKEKQLSAKDKQLSAKDEQLSAQGEQLSAQDEELRQLRAYNAQLARQQATELGALRARLQSEGVPPTNDSSTGVFNCCGSRPS